MSYFNNDHLKISNIIIDFEQNLSVISDFNNILISINNIDEFNNLRAQLNKELKNIENETYILINTLKIIQYNIRKLYDDFGKMQCNCEELGKKLKAKNNDYLKLLSKNKEIDKLINYKNQIIEEQNKHILELVKFNKDNDKIIKDLKHKMQNKNRKNIKNNDTKFDTSYKNQTLNNDKILHYKNFLNMKNNFNRNLKNNVSTLTEENNKMNIKNKIINNCKKVFSENYLQKTKDASTIDNEKYIFRDELEQNDEETDNIINKNKTTINNSTSTFNNKKESNSTDNIKEKIKKNNDNEHIIYENTKDKILNQKNKKLGEKTTNKLKRKGQSAKNIHKIKNKNFVFDIETNKLTRYFLFNLQREKVLNNNNFIKLIREKAPKYKM